MTFVDSLDSVLMLYSYTNFSERSLRIFKTWPTPVPVLAEALPEVSDAPELPYNEPSGSKAVYHTKNKPTVGDQEAELPTAPLRPIAEVDRKMKTKDTTMSGLSIILTLISILLAFR
jgi:nickel/cobalt transporter (NiCoT) family protein